MYRRTPIFFRIVDSFFRHQLLFWSALLLVSSLTMLALYMRSKTFHASATTQVQVESVASELGQGDTNTWVTPAQKHIDRFNDLIKQNQPGGFLDVALKPLYAPTDGTRPKIRFINVNPQADDPRYVMLQKNLSTYTDSANQFSIVLTWDNAAEAESILGALQQQYILEVNADRTVVSRGSVNFLTSQIDIVKSKMVKAENALADFKRSNNGQLSDAESTDSSELGSLRAQLDEKRVTLGESASKKRALEAELAQMKPMSVAEQTVSDQSPMEREVAAILAQRATMLASGKTPQHPDVVRLDTEITELQRQQRNSSAPENQHNTQTKMQDNPQYQLLQQQITEAGIAQVAEQQEMQNLGQQIDKYQHLMDRIPTAERELADKTRDYAGLSKQYNDLWTEQKAIESKGALDALEAKNILQPVGFIYATPTTGKTKLIAMLLGSLLLGCLVGAILVVLSEWSDHSLRYEGDAERLLGVPVLAALPETAELRTTLSRRALVGAGAPMLPGHTPEG